MRFEDVPKCADGSPDIESDEWNLYCGDMFGQMLAQVVNEKQAILFAEIDKGRTVRYFNGEVWCYLARTSPNYYQYDERGHGVYVKKHISRKEGDDLIFENWEKAEVWR